MHHVSGIYIIYTDTHGIPDRMLGLKGRYTICMDDCVRKIFLKNFGIFVLIVKVIHMDINIDFSNLLCNMFIKKLCISYNLNFVHKKCMHTETNIPHK